MRVYRITDRTSGIGSGGFIGLFLGIFERFGGGERREKKDTLDPGRRVKAISPDSNLILAV